MTKRRNYLRYHELDISIDDHATEDILDLLNQTVLGTPGGIRYRLKNIQERLASIPEIFFLSLRKFSHLLGTVGFVKRTFIYQEERYNVFYLRYFSIKSPISTATRKGVRKRKDPVRQNKRNILKERSEAFMVNAHKYLTTEKGGKTVLFAYIERENVRSMEMSERMGYHTVGILTNVFFSRVFPKKDPAVGRIKEEDKKRLRERLTEFYRDFMLYTEESLFYQDNYFVYRINGDIVAGVQATPAAWEIKVLPGISGKIFQKIVPYIPFLRKLFNPDNFRFLTLDAIYYAPGYEHILIPLFESVLSLQGIHTAITWHDTRSPVLKTIHGLKKLGVFGKLVTPKPVEIRMRFIGLSKKEKNLFHKNPSYMIAADAT